MFRISLSVLAAFMLAPIFPTCGLAQEPHILSENVQHFASEIGLAKELGIDWSAASSEDIAHYVSVLTATDIVAAQRAQAGKREPSFEDYQFAASILCRIDLPNMPKKPPQLAQYTAGVFDRAYVADQKREVIMKAVGPLASEASLEMIRTDLGPNVTFEEYSEKLFDFPAAAE
jgi:hypothetical protein